MTRRTSLLLAGLLLELAGCGTDPMAGKGAASETTNGIILEGRVVGADGTPAARATVQLRSPASDSVLAATLSDDSGKYVLGIPRPGRYVVRNVTDTLAASQWVSVGTAPRQRIPPATVAKLSTLRGKVVGETGDLSGIRVRAPGLDLETSVGSDSSWSIAGVPAGWHLVQASRNGGILGEAVGSTYVPRDIPLNDRATTLLDDFEGDQGQGTLTQLLDGAWWGRWNDTSQNFDSARTWKGTSGLSTDSSAWSGKSLHASMRVGSAISGHGDLDRSAGVEIKVGGREDLDSQSVWFDLAPIDSVVFWAKGSGTISFELRCRAKANGTRFSFAKSILLQPGWTRIAIGPGQFSTDGTSPWQDSRIRELDWITHDSQAELWLDDIRFVGIRPSDLLKR